MINYSSLAEAWGNKKETSNNIDNHIKNNKIYKNNDSEKINKDTKDLLEIKYELKNDIKNELVKDLKSTDYFFDYEQVTNNIKYEIKNNIKSDIHNLENEIKHNLENEIKHNLHKKIKKELINEINLQVKKNNNKKSNKIEHFNNLNLPFNFSINKHIKVYGIFILMFILLILLVHSYRKPVKLEGSQKSFYIFPEDLNKLKELINISK